MPERLKPIVLDILSLPKRHDVAERLATVAMMILRNHGSSRTMRQRPLFNLKLRMVGFKLGLTKDHMVTVLKYLRGRLVEPIIDDTFPKERWANGSWMNKATQWRFTRPVAMLLARIHDRAESRRAVKSDNYTRFRIRFFGEKGSLTNFLLDRKEQKTCRAFLSELRMPRHSQPTPVVCRELPSKPTGVVEIAKRVVPDVVAAVHKEPLFPAYKYTVDPRVEQAREAAQEAAEIARARKTVESDPEMDRWRAMIARRRIV